MECADARERILVAAPPALAGEGRGELAAHLRECADCRRRARTLLEGQERLAGALEAAAREMGRPASERTGRSAAGAGTDRRRWRTAAGVAVAAAAALLLWLLPGIGVSPEGGPDPVVEIPAPWETGGFEIAAPSAGDVAVFRTGDPDLIVVWHLGRSGGS